MRKNKRVAIVSGLVLLIGFTLGCVLPGAAQATPTPTPTQGAVVSNGGGNSGDNSGTGQNGGGSNGGSDSSNGSNNGATASPTEAPSATPTPPIPSPKPYLVQQIETLGGEKISGSVCDLTKPFTVNSVTPKVSFVFVFVPKDEQKGKVSYKYSIPSAGESHDASGTYSIAALAGSDGTLQLSLAVSDHVVFKGFDGNIPNRYKFNLVPSDEVKCP